jgi:hypothetical protein
MWTIFQSPELVPSATFEIDMKTFARNDSAISLDQGETVSISYDTAQDQVQMMYQTDSGTDWAPVPNDASMAITIDVPCGDTGMAVTFLTISTDDASTASATITVTKTNEDCNCQPGDFSPTAGSTAPVINRQASANSNSCPGKPPSGGTNGTTSSGTIDSCLYGTWDLDLDAMKVLINQVVGSNADYTVAHLQVTGLSTFTADPPNVGSFSFQSLTVDMHIAIPSFGTTETSTVMDGKVEANIIYVAHEQVSLDLVSGTATWPP